MSLRSPAAAGLAGTDGRCNAATAPPTRAGRQAASADGLPTARIPCKATTTEFTYPTGTPTTADRPCRWPCLEHLALLPHHEPPRSTVGSRNHNRSARGADDHPTRREGSLGVSTRSRASVCHARARRVRPLFGGREKIVSRYGWGSNRRRLGGGQSLWARPHAALSS